MPEWQSHLCYKYLIPRKTLETRPSRWSSSPLMVLPVKFNSIAWFTDWSTTLKANSKAVSTLNLPKAFVSLCVPPAPGIVSIFISGSPNFVELAAQTTSHYHSLAWIKWKGRFNWTGRVNWTWRFQHGICDAPYHHGKLEATPKSKPNDWGNNRLFYYSKYIA